MKATYWVALVGLLTPLCAHASGTDEVGRDDADTRALRAAVFGITLVTRQGASLVTNELTVARNAPAVGKIIEALAVCLADEAVLFRPDAAANSIVTHRLTLLDVNGAHVMTVIVEGGRWLHIARPADAEDFRGVRRHDTQRLVDEIRNIQKSAPQTAIRE